MANSNKFRGFKSPGDKNKQVLWRVLSCKVAPLGETPRPHFALNLGYKTVLATCDLRLIYLLTFDYIVQNVSGLA